MFFSLYLFIRIVFLHGLDKDDYNKWMQAKSESSNFIYHQIYFSNYFVYLCIEYRLDYINIESLLQRK